MSWSVPRVSYGFAATRIWTEMETVSILYFQPYLCHCLLNEPGTCDKSSTNGGLIEGWEGSMLARSGKEMTHSISKDNLCKVSVCDLGLWVSSYSEVMVSSCQHSAQYLHIYSHSSALLLFIWTGRNHLPCVFNYNGFAESNNSRSFKNKCSWLGVWIKITFISLFIT